MTFFDSNVLLYLVSGDTAKANRAEQLVRAGGTISVQVLAEFSYVARRKFKLGWDDIEAVKAAIVANCGVVDLTHAMHVHAVTIARADGLTIFDAQIVAAALATNAMTLWSEDMQDGRVFDGRLTIRNPFRVAS